MPRGDQAMIRIATAREEAWARELARAAARQELRAIGVPISPEPDCIAEFVTDHWVEFLVGARAVMRLADIERGDA